MGNWMSPAVHDGSYQFLIIAIIEIVCYNYDCFKLQELK